METITHRGIETEASDVVHATSTRVQTPILKVSATSKTPAVAGAIAGVIREHGRAEVQAIGAGAVNQATKAVAIARGYLALEGYDIICIPAFVDVMIAEQEKTAIKLIVESR